MMNRMQRYFEELDAGSNPDILLARLLIAIAQKLAQDYPADAPIAAGEHRVGHRPGVCAKNDRVAQGGKSAPARRGAPAWV
jgi:hypothetical protein